MSSGEEVSTELIEILEQSPERVSAGDSAMGGKTTTVEGEALLGDGLLKNSKGSVLESTAEKEGNEIKKHKEEAIPKKRETVQTTVKEMSPSIIKEKPKEKKQEIIDNTINKPNKSESAFERPPLEKTPSFLRPTLSLLSPKMNDIKEHFPDSPASKRGIMMKITPNSQKSVFDSIFLYDDTEKESNDDDRYDPKLKDIKSIPTLFRPTMSKLALPEMKSDAGAITKRGTMVSSTNAPQFTSKFTLKLQDAQRSDLENIKKEKKPSIPREAFKDAVLPVNKGHEFETTVPPRKSPVPSEVFTECIKVPLRDRIIKVADIITEKPPHVMKSPVPCTEFSPSPTKKIPTINENKPIKSLKQLHQFIKRKAIIGEIGSQQIQRRLFEIIDAELEIEVDLTRQEFENEIETMSHYNRATPQRRMYKKVMQASVSASALTNSMSTIATEADIFHAKKIMQSSLSTEFNKSRHGMSRVKLDCDKEIERLKYFAREAADVVYKLVSRYLSTIRKSAQRSSDAFKHYTASLANYNKLVPSPHKNAMQKRLHLIINQETTTMCTSLEAIEDILSTIENIGKLLQKKRNIGDYNFHHTNPVHLFPEYIRCYFSNPTLSPSKMKLTTKKLSKRRRRKKKARNIEASHVCFDETNETPRNECDDGALFDISDDDETSHGFNNVMAPESVIEEDNIKMPIRISQEAVVNNENIPEQKVTQKDIRNDVELIQDDVCVDEDMAMVKRPSIVSEHSFTDQMRIDSHNLSQSDSCFEEKIMEQDVLHVAVQKQFSGIQQNNIVIDNGVVSETGACHDETHSGVIESDLTTADICTDHTRGNIEDTNNILSNNTSSADLGRDNDDVSVRGKSGAESMLGLNSSLMDNEQEYSFSKSGRF